MTLADSSLGVYSSKIFTLLRYSVSAFQFFVFGGTRTEENKLYLQHSDASRNVGLEKFLIAHLTQLLPLASHLYQILMSEGKED